MAMHARSRGGRPRRVRLSDARPLAVLIAALPLLLCALAPAAVAQSEAQLVVRGRAEAETIWRRGFTLGDQELDTCLQALLDSLALHMKVNPQVRLQAHVFRSPDPNAFSLPDGSVYVFAGLLAELETWDQVQFILAHEAQHSLNAHAHKFMSQGKTKIALLQIASLGVTIGLGTSSMSGAGLVNSFSQLGLALAAAASVTGFGRGLESEADREGAHAVQAGGHDACAPVQALQALTKDGKQGSRVSNFFWGDHPLLQDRISAMRQLTPAPCGGIDSAAAAAYLPTRRAMTALTARLWLDMGKPARALETCSGYLALAPEDSEAHCMLGEAYLLCSAMDTVGLAIAEFEKALQLSSDAYRRPHLGLALAVEKQGDTLSAIPHLEQYLAGDARVPKRRMLTRQLADLKARFQPGSPALTDSLCDGESAIVDSLGASPGPASPTRAGGLPAPERAAPDSTDGEPAAAFLDTLGTRGTAARDSLPHAPDEEDER